SIIYASYYISTYIPTFLHPFFILFFFNDTATTEIYTLSLHDALPILFVTENFERRRVWDSFRQSRARRVQVDPNIPVALFARIMAGKDALDFQLVLRNERWNLNALAAACVKPPAVVAALDHVAIHAAVGQRDAPVRARIPHR